MNNLPDQYLNDRSSYGISSHVSQNIYEYSKLMSGWEIELNQYTHGKFMGELIIIEDNGFQLIHDKSNISLQKNGQSQYDTVITFPINKNFKFDKFYCQGNRMQNFNILISHGKSLPELIVPDHSEVITISLFSHEIEQYIQKNQFIHNKNSIILPNFSPIILEEFKLLIHNIKYKSQLPKDYLNTIKDIIIELLSNNLDKNENYHIHIHTKKRIVDQAKQIILSQSDKMPSTLEVCHELGISRRTLQYCFQEVLGVNPKTYFKIVRLNQVYRCLSQGISNVQDIAYQWGFWHLGHFSSDYKKMFGELPSVTLAHAK